MDIADAAEFLADNHHAVLITRRSDGGVQSSPVTVGVDDAGRPTISTREQLAKIRNLRRDPRVTLCVFTDGFFGMWMQIEGTADIVPATDPEGMAGLVEYYRRISGEHPDWDDYRAAMIRDGRVLLRVDVTRVVGP